MIKKLILLMPLLTTSKVLGNVEGTEFQHFNPSATGLDYVTVHSSKTLSTGVFNLGLFVNYSRNALPEFSTDDGQTFKDRQKLRNQLLATDINIALGLADWWDIGINIPITNYQKVQVKSTRIEFKKQGVNDLRFTSKFGLLSKKKASLAFIGSVNLNLIEGNPYTGNDPGLTYNGSVAFDTRIQSVNMGINAGYRQRNPGSPIEGVPVVPFQDQYIASVAVSYLFKTWDVLGIMEVFTSEPAGTWDEESKPLGRTREGLLGFKYLQNHNLAYHGGIGSALHHSTSSPDLRLYLGVNWAFKPIQKLSTQPPSVSIKADTPKIQRYTLGDIEFSFDSARIVPGALVAVDDILSRIKLGDVKLITIIGHTDSLGSEEYNLSLSQRRAMALAEYVIDKFGVPVDKVKAIGRGELEPIASNENFQGRQKNRRVVIEITLN